MIVSHQAQTLEQFATQAAVLRDGQFIQFDTLEEARQVYDFETQSEKFRVPRSDVLQAVDASLGVTEGNPKLEKAVAPAPEALVDGTSFDLDCNFERLFLALDCSRTEKQKVGKAFCHRGSDSDLEFASWPPEEC